MPDKSSPPQRDPSPPLPSTSQPFNFSCRCTNVSLQARVSKEDADRVINQSSSSQSGKSEHAKAELEVWIIEKGETSKHPAYVSWDQDDFRPTRSLSDDLEGGSVVPNGDTLRACWRKCWICGVEVYNAKGKEKDDPAVEEEWVTIDPRKGIMYGEEFDRLSSPPRPFSDLHLSIPNTTSTFGRPPHAPQPDLYPSQSSPPVPSSSTHDHRSSPSLIPAPHDPFFLPPPFIPAHPHLSSLCNLAVTFLSAEHAKLEDEVKAFIAGKAKEMRAMEEMVRGEVEVLWEKWVDGPGKGDALLERGRSSSMSRPSGEEARKPKVENGRPMASPPAGEKANPIISSAIASPPYAPQTSHMSALSASLSANAFYAPPPPPPAVANQLEDSISAISKSTKKSGRDRELAVSQVFSTLDSVMGKRLAGGASGDPEPEAGLEEAKDSWIDGERRIAGMAKVEENGKEGGKDKEGEEGGRTPMPGTRELRQNSDGKRGKKDKGKAVKFEEPSRSAEGSPEEPSKAELAGGEGIPDKEDEDYVFDFELGEGDTERPSPESGHYESNRPRNIVEANLSRTFAADAPSHRAAWRRMQQSSSIYASLRRDSSFSSASGSTGEHDLDERSTSSYEAGISKLATSVPVHIIGPKGKHRATAEVLPLERKTSLSEREGILVPSLLGAMREKGISSAGNSLALGLDGPTPRASSPSRMSRKDRRGSTERRRSASASRERAKDEAFSLKADPGAVFESMGDEDEEDEQGRGNPGRNEQAGGGGGRPGFVPPHVVARREEREDQYVGWRSLVNE